MLVSLKRWRARHLLLAWSAYWAGLVLVTLGEPLRLMWRLTRGPDSHGSFSASFDDTLLKLTIVEGSRTVWAGATELSTLVAWLAGPPLLLWLMWLVLRTRPDGEASPTRRAEPPRGLRAGPADWQERAPADADAARPSAHHEG